MFKSYLIVAIRNIARQKYFTLINVFGLALGMSFSLLLLSFYFYVSSFDDFHSRKERIYRIISTLESAGEKTDFASAPLALAHQLERGSMGIEAVTRVNTSFRADVVTDKMNIPVQGYYVDSNFFSVFDFQMIRGNPYDALSEPNSIVLTESVAKKFEASGDLLGETLQMEGLGTFKVTGIVKDQRRTHLWFEALVSFNTLPAARRGEESHPDQWTHFKDQYVYVLTHESNDRRQLQQILSDISRDVSGQSENASVTFHLQPLTGITPGPDLENATGGDTDYTLFVVFATICLLILLPACFNYANISIARALKRSKEVGLRKTLGGRKTHIFLQFVTETLAIMVISLMAALLLFTVIRPEFENMMPGGWLDLSLTWEMLSMFLLFAVVTGFLTGVLPALHFAGLNPIQALKDKSGSKGTPRMRLRKALIVSQFALSFCFIVLLVVFSRQYRYTLNFDYGFNTQNILDVELQGVKPAIMNSEYSRLSAVQDISMSSGILGLSYSNSYVHDQQGRDSVKVAQLFTDSHYITNMGLQLIAGKRFPDAPPQGEQYILVNEEFLHAWQIASVADALEKVFIVDGKELKVIGVLRNFHYAPLQQPIKAFCFRTDPSMYRYANLKVSSGDIHQTIAGMETIWNKLTTKKFEAHFFDDEMESVYHFYEALIKMIGFLGLIAVSITLLGLLGMVIYTVEGRTKEIGIRKVFGARETTITYLLSKDFLRLMAWAIVIAIPATTLFVDDFLSLLQYYRVSLNAWDLLFSLIVFALIGIGTIASQTWRASQKNPVEVLRYE